MGNHTEPFRTSEIHRIDVDQLDSRSKHVFTNSKTKNPGGGIRSEIRELSRQSRSRLIYKARNIPNLQRLITFTYPSEDWANIARGGNFMTDGKVVKDHLRKLRQLFTYRNCYGFWFLEFQKRGAPHFHFFLSGSLSETDISKIKRTWYRMVGSDCPHHLQRGSDFQILRKQHSAGAYASKYSSKDEQKVVPEHYRGVGRFWGLFGDIPSETHEIETSVKEIYRLVRIARYAQKADARSKGFKYRKRSRGTVGTVLYNSGLALRYYLLRRYTIPDNPDQISLVSRHSHNPASEHPL